MSDDKDQPVEFRVQRFYESIEEMPPKTRENFERHEREREVLERIVREEIKRELEDRLKDAFDCFNYLNTSGRPAIHWRDIKWPHK